MHYEIVNEVDYKKVLLDPFNPRFDGELEEMTQIEILEHIKKGDDYKELRESMEKSIRWINLIVVRPIKDLDKITRKKLNIPNIDDYEYIVIEGNTRLTYLYDCGEQKGIKYSPLSIFKLEDYERDDDSKREEYNLEIMYIQGQANILKVKDWNDKPKCNHVYKTFIKRRKHNESESTSAIISDLAKRYSGKVGDIRKALVRCSIVRKYESFGYKLDEKDWAYLEAVETKAGNIYMGLNDDYEFNSCLDKKSYDILFERYCKFYDMIQEFKGKKENSKKFRNFFRENYLKNNSEDIELTGRKKTLSKTEKKSTKGNRKSNNEVNNKNGASSDFEENKNNKEIMSKIRDEYYKQKKDIDYRKFINIDGKNIYDPHTEIDVYSNYVLLKDKYPQYISINIPSYSQNTTYDSLGYYDDKDEELFWCDFKKVLPNDIKNYVDDLQTIICWEISHSNRYGNFYGRCIDGERIKLKLQKNDVNDPGYKFELINEERNIKIEIIELKDIWETATRKKFM